MQVGQTFRLCDLKAVDRHSWLITNEPDQLDEKGVASQLVKQIFIGAARTCRVAMRCWNGELRSSSGVLVVGSKDERFVVSHSRIVNPPTIQTASFHFTSAEQSPGVAPDYDRLAIPLADRSFGPDAPILMAASFADRPTFSPTPLETLKFIEQKHSTAFCSNNNSTVLYLAIHYYFNWDDGQAVTLFDSVEHDPHDAGRFIAWAGLMNARAAGAPCFRVTCNDIQLFGIVSHIVDSRVIILPATTDTLVYNYHKNKSQAEQQRAKELEEEASDDDKVD